MSADLCTEKRKVLVVPPTMSAFTLKFFVWPAVTTNGFADISNVTVPSTPSVAAVAPSCVAPSINLMFVRSVVATEPTFVNLRLLTDTFWSFASTLNFHTSKPVCPGSTVVEFGQLRSLLYQGRSQLRLSCHCPRSGTSLKLPLNLLQHQMPR